MIAGRYRKTRARPLAFVAEIVGLRDGLFQLRLAHAFRQAFGLLLDRKKLRHGNEPRSVAKE